MARLGEITVFYAVIELLPSIHIYQIHACIRGKGWKIFLKIKESRNSKAFKLVIIRNFSKENLRYIVTLCNKIQFNIKIICISELSKLY